MQGHIRKRTHTTTRGKSTITWYVVIDLPRDADGKRRQKWHGGYRTRREAEAARVKIVHDFNTGTYVEPSAITLSGWVRELWLPTMRSRVKPSTFDSYRRNLDLHVLLPRLGSRQLRQITPSMLNRLYADLLASGNKKVTGGLSAKTVRYIHTIIHKALADAIDAGLIALTVERFIQMRRLTPEGRQQTVACVLDGTGTYCCASCYWSATMDDASDVSIS